ncbi:Neural Cell Adhesion Molecule 2 [Manis pentadactyla]|nr:Neural Cell Adhesion Molecule 2 [Manis pentadactyla]
MPQTKGEAADVGKLRSELGISGEYVEGQDLNTSPLTAGTEPVLTIPSVTLRGSRMSDDLGSEKFDRKLEIIRNMPGSKLVLLNIPINMLLENCFYSSANLVDRECWKIDSSGKSAISQVHILGVAVSFLTQSSVSRDDCDSVGLQGGAEKKGCCHVTTLPDYLINSTHSELIDDQHINICFYLCPGIPTTPGLTLEWGRRQRITLSALAGQGNCETEDFWSLRAKPSIRRE